jgi:siroheme synthase
MASITRSEKAGSLVIVGTGITSIGQITLQGLTAIENATKVFYVVGDPVTEAFIRTKNKDCFDLAEYYDNSKSRNDSYVQMSEVIVGSYAISVRATLNGRI